MTLMIAGNNCGTKTYKSMSTFQEDIKEIDRKIVDLTWPGGLFRYDEFKEIYTRAGWYKKSALQSLGSQELTEQQKLIVALSMQKLPFDQFLEFAWDVTDLYKQDKISSKVLHWCVLPTYDWNTMLIENYQHPDVKTLLKLLAGLSGLDEEFRTFVEEDVLTGKAVDVVEQMRDTGQIR